MVEIKFAQFGKFQITVITAVKGRIHINNGEICKMIKPEDLQTYLDKGWICGRIYIRNTCHS